jgi:23S rRNA (guanine745-N1)-methyltransferase
MVGGLLLNPELASLLRCPVCAGALLAGQRSLVCAQGHTFDVAREGYVNLLPSGRRARDLGDSRPMLTARRSFFDRGHYDPLAARIADKALPFLPAGGSVVDLGCGEGYYLGWLHRAGDFCCIGVDASKDAARLASRRYPRAGFVVADLWRDTCIASAAADLALNIFAPRHATEFARLLRPGGRLLVCLPAAGHLGALRQRYGLMGIESGKEERLRHQTAEQFEWIGREELRFPLQLTGPDVAALCAMRPDARHAGVKPLPGGDLVADEVQVILLEGQKKGEGNGRN